MQHTVEGNSIESIRKDIDSIESSILECIYSAQMNIRDLRVRLRKAKLCFQVATERLEKVKVLMKHICDECWSLAPFLSLPADLDDGAFNHDRCILCSQQVTKPSNPRGINLPPSNSAMLHASAHTRQRLHDYFLTGGASFPPQNLHEEHEIPVLDCPYCPFTPSPIQARRNQTFTMQNDEHFFGSDVDVHDTVTDQLQLIGIPKKNKQLLTWHLIT